MINIITGSTSRYVVQLSVLICLLAILCGTNVQAQYGPYVNGSMFVIGLYDYPGGGIPDSHFADIQNYFNTVDYFCHNANWDSGDIPETLTPATLNSAVTNGLYITSEMWVTSDPAHDYCDTPADFLVGGNFYDDLQTFGAYPALLMFANRDEADDYMSATQCVAASTFMRTYDKGKNVWLNLSSMMDLPVSGFQQYVPGATVVSTDAYPDEWGDNLDSEKNAVDTLHAITPVSKMIILPGYPNANGNILDSNSTSYVTYSCIIHGATGIWFWGCDQMTSTSDPLWQDIRVVGSQLKFMQSALINPKAHNFYNSYTGSWVGTGVASAGGSGNLEVLLVTNVSYDYLITVNTSTSSQTYTISSVAGWRGGTNLWYFCGPGGTNNQVLGESITYGPKQTVVYASQSIKVPPIITNPLSSQTCIAGATLSFNCGNVSWWPQTYQWYFNGSPISGQTAATLTLNNVQTNNAGNYSVVISNSEGSSTNAASLVVQAYFGPTATIASDLDVMTNGLFVYAYDLSGTNTTVNGVTFAGATSTTALGSNIALSGFYANYNGYGSSSSPFSGLSSSYQTVLTGGDYASGATSATVTLKNLTVGHAYAIQLWVDDSRSFGNGRTMTFTNSNGNTVTLSYNSTGSDGGVGQYTISTFTANTVTQVITITGNNSTQMNAIQVRDISGTAPVAFGAADGISGDSDVSTNGALVYAYDLSGITATVNEVIFTGATSTATLGSDVVLSGFNGGNYNGYGSGVTNLSPNYINLLTGGDYANGATVATVTLNNLMVGHSYAVQIWVNDSRSFGFGIGRTMTATTIATNANSVTLSYDIAGLGQFAIGTFTATATTQPFTLFGNASTQLNAIQLRDVSANNSSFSINGTVRNANGSVTLNATGISENSYVVQFTTNLTPPIVWQNIGTNMTGSSGQWQFTDTNAANHSTGFYRMLCQP